jgi:hypothetical protein
MEETNTNRQIHNNKSDIMFCDNERGNVCVDTVAISRDRNVIRRSREDSKITRILLQKYSACGMEK